METPRGKSANQKMLDNIRAMRKANARAPGTWSPEELQSEIEKWKPDIEKESAAERKLSGIEKVAAVGSKLGSGFTFGLLDEAVGLFDEDAKNEQRFLQKQLSEENPKTALAAEIVGGLAVPGSIFKVAPKLAKTASAGAKALRTVRRVATPLAEGAVQGGVSGIGNAEGTLEERLGAGASGAKWGAGLAGGIAGVGRGVNALRRATAVKRGVHTPTLDEMVGDIDPASITAGKARYSELDARKLGDEAMLADVLPEGEGALRSQATSNKATRNLVDAELKGRSNRLSNLADERLSERTGTQRQSGKKTLAEQNDIATTESRPEYEAAEAEWLAFRDKPAVERKPAEKLLRAAAKEPEVRRIMDDLRADDTLDYTGASDDDHFLLDRVYKDLGERIRDLGDTKARSGLSYADGEVHRSLIRQRGVLGKAIEARSPAYRKALDKYAGPMANKRAYESGAKNTPADMVPSAMEDLSPSESQFYREGATQNRLRANAPNADLGEFGKFADVLAPVASREKAELFQSLHGKDAYKEYLADMLDMAKLQRMKAGGGESTTVDKLIEQLQAGGNADLGPILGALASGSPGAAARGAVMSMVTGGLNKLTTSRKNADANAKFLMRKGGDVPQTLDEMLQRQSVLAQPRRRPSGLRGGGNRGLSLDAVKDAAAREAGAIAGRR